MALSISRYNVLLGALQVEGRDDEVQAALAEMRAAGIEPDERTQAKLGRSYTSHARNRTP